MDAETNFELADFVGDKLPPGSAKAKAFTDERVWHMGIVLAAQELELDLAHADVDLPEGSITLHGTNGVERVIPVDADGYFYVDWRLTPNDPRLTSAPIENLLWQDKERLLGETNGPQRRLPGQAGGGRFRRRRATTSPTVARRRWKETRCWSANTGTSPIPSSPADLSAALRWTRNWRSLFFWAR